MVKSTSCITIDFMNMSQLTERTFTPSESLSSLSLFLSLARGQCRPGKFWHRRSFRQKFLLRSLIMPRLSVEWMNELSHWPNLNVLLTRQPRLPVRLHRPYLAANLSRKQLLEALRYHYALLRGCMSAEEFSLYLNTPGLQLAKLEGKNGEQFTLELTMMISMDKEGDSTILFRNSEGIPLAELTFTLCEYQGKGRCLLADCKAQNGKFHTRNPECDESLPRAISQTPRDGSGLSVCPTFAGRADYCRQQ